MSNEAAILKRKMKLSKADRSTIIYALAISPRDDENRLHAISCKSGMPMGPTTYDFVADCFYVKCAMVLSVGTAAVAYDLEIEGVQNWTSQLPLPEAIFRNYLSPKSIRRLDDWKSELPNRWKVKYIQIASVF